MSDTLSLPAKPAELITFDSGRHPERDRFARYRALYSGGADAIEAGPDFSARLRSWRMEGGVIYDRILNDVIHERDAARVVHDEFTHCTLTLVLSGSYEVDIGAGFHAVPPGSAILLDMTVPMRNRARGAHIITTSLARDRVRSAAPSATALHGLLLPPPQVDLLADYLRSLVQRIEHVPQASLGAAVAAMVPLLSIALAGVTAPATIGSVTGDARIAQVRRLVDRHCGNPAFGPGDIVRLSGLSRATVYRLFKSQGGIAAFLQRRRLELVRAALADHAETRSFATLAEDTGFASESHCSRLFRKVFGARPGEYRAAQLSPRGDPDPGRRLLSWQTEVR